MKPTDPEQLALSGKLLMMIARKLRTVAKREPERFDYQEWVGRNWKGKADLSCGTTACALGWATTIPALRRRGLRLYLSASNFVKGYVGIAGHPPEQNGLGSAQNSIEAAMEALLLDEDEAQFLFYPANWFDRGGERAPDDEATALEVAEHIERFVHQYRTTPRKSA